jgi:hypothetical protein
MGLKAVSVGNKRPTRRYLSLLIVMLCALTVSVIALAQAPEDQKTFSTHDASTLLNQINDGLVNRSAGKFLSAFDLSRMDNSQTFKQQITSFIAHADSIRMHFNLTGVSMEGHQGEATVDAEMEADTGSGAAPLHKQATLRFVAVQTGSGWKFVDVQPRSFFSTSSASAATSPFSR